MRVEFGPGFDRVECAIIAILTRTRHLSTLASSLGSRRTVPAQPSPTIYASVRAADHLQRRRRLRRTRYGEWMLSDPAAYSETKQRLAAILGMLGSAHDGEILAAARAAEKGGNAKQLGATWPSVA